MLAWGDGTFGPCSLAAAFQLEIMFCTLLTSIQWGPILGLWFHRWGKLRHGEHKGLALKEVGVSPWSFLLWTHREAGQGGRCRVASGTVLIPSHGLASFVLATSPEGGRTYSLVPWDVIPVEGTQAQRGHVSSQWQSQGSDPGRLGPGCELGAVTLSRRPCRVRWVPCWRRLWVA